MEDLHNTTKGTVVNRGCIGKPRVTKAICFYVRKNTLQIRMNLNQFLKSFIKGNFVRGRNKDCEICSDLFVCMYVWLIDTKTKRSKCRLFQKTGTYVCHLTMAVLWKMSLLPAGSLYCVLCWSINLIGNAYNHMTWYCFNFFFFLDVNLSLLK